jgi:chemotaxis protein MotA
MGGLALALAGILGGLVLEDGKVKDVAQLTAAIIVLGGTLGAVMVTTPMGILRSAAGKLLTVFFEATHAPEAVVEQIIGYATKARKNGIVSLEEDTESIEDPFLRKAMKRPADTLPPSGSSARCWG